MADKQPPRVKEGATTGDVDDDVAHSAAARSAEDRKTASAMANLEDDAPAAAASSDAEAVKQAVQNLEKVSGAGNASAAAAAAAATKTAGKNGTATPPKKNVKVDAADVALLVQELDMPKPRATEFLKAHDGDAVAAMRAYVNVEAA